MKEKVECPYCGKDINVDTDDSCDEMRFTSTSARNVASIAWFMLHYPGLMMPKAGLQKRACGA